MFDCRLVKRYGRKKRQKKGPSLVYRFQRSMESGDASNEEASPRDPISNNQTQNERSKAISMLVDMEAEDGLKRCAVMVIAEKIGLPRADLLYYKCKNFLLLLCTPVVLIYNSELGLINSSEFFRAKKLRKKRYLLPSSCIYLFYLGNLFVI